MSERAALVAFERGVAEALRAADPVLAMAALADLPGLPAGLRLALGRLDADGVRISALLVARLRFERLLSGSREVGTWYARDPEGFTEAFRAYHAACPPRAFWPAAEAAAFEAWRKEGG